jgi:hypothetical protein
MEGVSAFMERAAVTTGSPPTPILLLNSLQMDRMNAEQLLSYVRTYQKADSAAG